MGECVPAGFGNIVPLRAIIPGFHSSLLREFPSRDDDCCSPKGVSQKSCPSLLCSTRGFTSTDVHHFSALALGSYPAEMSISSQLWPIITPLLHSTKICIRLLWLRWNVSKSAPLPQCCFPAGMSFPSLLCSTWGFPPETSIAPKLSPPGGFAERILPWSAERSFVTPNSLKVLIWKWEL